MVDFKMKTKPNWIITPQKVDAAINKILEVSKPKKLILFGSYVTGKIGLNSDLDILVVTREEIGSPRKESVRIRRALRDISIPMDILVIPETRLNKLANIPGLIYKEALERGKVVYESTE